MILITVDVVIHSCITKGNDIGTAQSDKLTAFLLLHELSVWRSLWRSVWRGGHHLIGVLSRRKGVRIGISYAVVWRHLGRRWIITGRRLRVIGRLDCRLRRCRDEGRI